MNTSPKKYQLLTGNALKMIAIVTMLIDHIGAVILEKALIPLSSNSIFSGNNTDYTISDYNSFVTMDSCFRVIGRIAFPIFLFLLVEGFLHTRDPFKYAFRLFIFALISEVPFDLAINGCVFELGYQNVFFTLTLSVLMFLGLEFAEGGIQKKELASLAKIALVLITLIAAELLNCDYGSLGIALALFTYLLRYDRTKLILSYSILILTYCMLNALVNGFSLSRFAELFALLAFFPIALYNGERGSFRFKYFFYVFYPAHLLILAGIRYLILK